MTNREWLNSLSDEDFCTALEQIDCRLCAFYGDCKGKQCRDGFIVWLKKEHKENDRPCPKCGGDNIRFDLTATANGFAIKAECRDCGQEFVIKHRDAVRKMWNDGCFEELTE